MLTNEEIEGMEEIESKPFGQDDYDENDQKGKDYSIAVLEFCGWECQYKEENKKKFDIICTKGKNTRKIEAEVRSDKKGNFDCIGGKWDDINVPARKCIVAKSKGEMAKYFFSWRDDGKYFWRIDLDYAVKFPYILHTCYRNGKRFREHTHKVAIDLEHTKKFRVVWSGEKVVSVREITTKIQAEKNP
jgi:hypothetical protein